MAVNLQDLLPLIAALQADPGADSRLSALADEVGLSPSHLQRVFARMVGESPSRIAGRIALERAAAMLVATGDTILDIALESGFDSHEGFTRAFRRQFGVSPSQYRERGLVGTEQTSPELAATHRELIERVGPCIGLFGARVAEASPRRSTMSYTVTKKTLQETPILFMRRRVEHDRIAEALGELLPAVYAHAGQKGIALAGPPFSRYADWSSGSVTLEAGMPIAAPAEGEGDILAGALQAGPAASTIHTGPYDSLHKAHAALENWLADNALKSAGAPWESYLTDPGQVPDPAQWQTEVIWPTNE